MITDFEKEVQIRELQRACNDIIRRHRFEPNNSETMNSMTLDLKQAMENYAHAESITVKRRDRFPNDLSATFKWDWEKLKRQKVIIEVINLGRLI